MERCFAAAVTIALAVSSVSGCSNNASQSPQTTQSVTVVAEGSTTETAASEKASSGADAPANKGGKTFGVTYWIKSDFFKTAVDFITSAVKADGNKTAAMGAQQDSIKQIQIIEDFIVQDVDAVFLNPVDKDAVASAFQKLKEAGIPVINFDSSVANLDLIDVHVATDNPQAGKFCTEAMIEDFPEGGLTAALNHPANNACLDREKRFLETIEGEGLEVTATSDVEGTVEKGQNITSGILQAHPDIVAIFSINDQAGMGAHAVCMTSGANVSIYGVDGAPEAKQAITKEGNIHRMTAAQSSIEIGTNCYDVTMTILSGEKSAQFRIDAPILTIDNTNTQDYLGAGWQ